MSDEGKVFLTGSAQGSLVAGAEDRAQIYIPYASEEGSNRGASKFPKILLKRILVHKASGGWRPVKDLKSLNAHIYAPQFHMFTTSSVLSTV